MKKDDRLFEKLVAHVNRKEWWHVPPRDPVAYNKRGKFFASSFREAEFWGRPLDEPQKVVVRRPLVGDENTIERALFGRRVSREGIEVEERWDTALRGSPRRPKQDSICSPGNKTIPNCAAFLTPRKSPRGFSPYEHPPHVHHRSGLVRLHRGRGPFPLPCRHTFWLLHLSAVCSIHPRQAWKAQPVLRSKAARKRPRLRAPLPAQRQGLPSFRTAPVRSHRQGQCPLPSQTLDRIHRDAA